MERSGRARRTGTALGLLGDAPRPTARQALRAALYALPALVVAALAATAVERAGGPEVVVLFLTVTPLWVMLGLLNRWTRDQRRVPRRRPAPPESGAAAPP